MNQSGEILAFDYGDVRIGVARATFEAKLPAPLVTLSNGDSTLQDIETLIDTHQPVVLIVGLPRGAEGQLTEQSEKATSFAELLHTRFSLPVQLQDESHTSQYAADEMQATGKQQDIDQLAAVYILDDYLRSAQ